MIILAFAILVTLVAPAAADTAALDPYGLSCSGARAQEANIGSQIVREEQDANSSFEFARPGPHGTARARYTCSEGLVRSFRLVFRFTNEVDARHVLAVQRDNLIGALGRPCIDLTGLPHSHNAALEPPNAGHNIFSGVQAAAWQLPDHQLMLSLVESPSDWSVVVLSPPPPGSPNQPAEERRLKCVQAE